MNFIIDSNLAISKVSPKNSSITMELFFVPKIEDSSSDELSLICIKNEEFQTDESSSRQIVKKEEYFDWKQNDDCLDISCAQQVKRFDNLLLSLEQYLENFVDVEDFTIPLSGMNDKETRQIIKEAQLSFKELGTQIIRSMGKDLKTKAMHHILPDAYVIQLIETTKRRIFNSYKQLKKNLAEVVSNIKDNQINTNETFVKSKVNLAKKKCDFPPRARALLKAWFIAHAQDPYPSHEEKIKLAREGGISMKQLENWLTNTRGRIWKKMRHETKFDTEIEQLLLNNEDKVL